MIRLHPDNSLPVEGWAIPSTQQSCTPCSTDDDSVALSAPAPRLHVEVSRHVTCGENLSVGHSGSLICSFDPICLAPQTQCRGQ